MESQTKLSYIKFIDIPDKLEKFNNLQNTKLRVQKNLILTTVKPRWYSMQSYS